MRLPWRRRKPVVWQLRVTSPDDGILLDIDTVTLEAIWRFGARSTDGFVDILEMAIPRVHLWVRPAGHVEPDRSQLLDGTGALPDRLRFGP